MKKKITHKKSSDIQKMPVLTEREIHLRKFFPNAITMTALAFGVSSLNMSFWGRWDMAVIFICLAAGFDFLGGGVGSFLHVES